MFVNLDDPNPPAPTDTQRRDVADAVSRHRRRRRTAAAAVAATFIVAAVALAALAGRGGTTSDVTASQPTTKTWPAFCTIAQQYKDRAEHPDIDTINHVVIPVDPAVWPTLVAAAPTPELAAALTTAKPTLLHTGPAGAQRLPADQQAALSTVNATLLAQCGYGTAIFGVVPTPN